MQHSRSGTTPVLILVGVAAAGCGGPVSTGTDSAGTDAATTGASSSTTEVSSDPVETSEPVGTTTETTGDGNLPLTVGPPISSSTCGNGVVEVGEQCDPGSPGPSDDYNKCSVDCFFEGPHCGDGILDFEFEQCDHGGTPDEPSESGDEYNACLANCQYEAGYCGDGVFDGENEECDYGEGASNPVTDAYCSPGCRGPNWVFVTSTTYQGDMSPEPGVFGLTGAIMICNNSAKAGGLPGEYRPWLATDNFEDCPGCSPATGFETKSGVPYAIRVTDGNGYAAYTIADDWEDLVTAEDGQFLQHKISHNEFGDEGDTPYVWTGVNPQGVGEYGASLTCNKWMETGGVQGVLGSVSRTDAGWTDYASLDCDTSLPIYCFRQSVE